MFEKRCSFYETFNDRDDVKEIGEVDLNIVYDDDVFGARIVAYLDSDEDDNAQACNHLIALQTCLEVDNANKQCSWSALDFSVDPPKYRSFRVAFTSSDDLEHFRDIFYEGKDLAEQSEIVELPEKVDEPYGYGSWLEQQQIRSCDPALGKALEDVIKGMVFKKK